MKNNFLQKYSGLIIVLVLGILPAVRWFFIVSQSPRFSSISTSATNLGQIFGILGMSFFAISLILSFRSQILDKIFYGISDVYNIHQKIGKIAFCFLLFHPLFLAVKFLYISIKSTLMFFVPQELNAQSLGTVALFLMALLIVLTIYVKLKYPHWKISHKFMVLVFVFAMMHTFMIESDISRDFILRYYVLAISVLGLVLSFYQAFLSMFFNKNFKYKVKLITNLNSQVVSIILEPVLKKIKFKPGQFVFVRFFSKNLSSESHPFSICSEPDGDNLEIVVKSLGDFTENIKNINVGDDVLVEGPFGKFSFNTANKNQVWLAGGVGITPFLSMAKSLNNNYKVDLFYCTKNKEEAVLINRLEEISAKNNNFKLINWYSDQMGFISAKAIESVSGDMLEKDFLLCGPTNFMLSLKNQLLKLGVQNKNIYFEDFNFK